MADVSLADLTQDIAGALPPDLVLRGNESDKSSATHSRLLEPYLVRGARVGIAKGEVFLFPQAGGGRDIDGNPVNVASKLSEDAGVDGILVEASAVTPAIVDLGQTLHLTISGVDLAGRVIHP